LCYLGRLLCTQNDVSVLSSFTADGSRVTRKLRFGDECATESTVTCKNPAEWRCDGQCGGCPCDYDASAGLSAHYMQTMFEQLGPWCSAASATSVLMIGLGGGELPQHLLHHCPRMHIEAVELNRDVIAMARTYFGLGEAETRFAGRLSIEQDDALTAVKQRSLTGDGSSAAGGQPAASGSSKYDAVLVDCFSGGGEVPESCRSRSFAETVKAILKPGGVMLQNIWHYSKMRQQVPAEFNATKATYGDVFEGGVDDLLVPMPAKIRWVDVLKATKGGV